MVACAAGHDEVVAALCAAGCDVRLLDTEGRSALLYAARRGHRRACELLISSDTALASEMIGQADETGLAPLAAAAINNHLAVVELLLAHGAALERAGEVGQTALMGAAFKGLAGVVRGLLDAGGDARAEDLRGVDAAADAATWALAPWSSPLVEPHGWHSDVAGMIIKI